MKQGWSLLGTKHMLLLKKVKEEIKFDIKVETKKGTNYCMRMTRKSKDTKKHMTGERTKIDDEATKKVLANFKELEIANKNPESIYNYNNFNCGELGHKAYQCIKQFYPKNIQAGEGMNMTTKKLSVENQFLQDYLGDEEEQKNQEPILDTIIDTEDENLLKHYTVKGNGNVKVIYTPKTPGNNKVVYNIESPSKSMNKIADEIAKDMKSTCNMPGDDIDYVFGDEYALIHQCHALHKKVRFPCNGEVMMEFCMNENMECNEISCAGLNQQTSTNEYAIGTSGINQDDITTSEDEETVKIKKRKTNKYELDMKSYAEIFYDFMQEGNQNTEENKKMGQE